MTSPAIAAPASVASRPRNRASKGVIAGRVLSGIAIAFLAADAFFKIFPVKAVIEGTQQLGYPVETIVPIGITLMTCVILYAIPATSVFGAVLLTGYLGGAIATHVRVENPLFSHVLFPVYVALLLWGGLYLRESRLAALLPSRK